MTRYQDEMDFIFRNYTVVFKHVFKALCFLEKHGIVHRDVKSMYVHIYIYVTTLHVLVIYHYTLYIIASNILVHQNCSCTSPLQCNCPGNGGVIYVLGDLDLLCLDEDTSASACTCEVWNRMVQRDPAGTVGMKPPEVCM